MRRVHVAIVGCGRAAALAAPCLRSLPGVTFGLASRRPWRASDASSRLGGAVAYPSYDAAIVSPEVDAVFVATPPSTHLDLAFRALAAGKHVIVEKPPVLRASDFDLLEAAAARASRQAMVAENYFYKPLARTLRAAVREEWVGEPRRIELRALKAQRAEGWRADPALCGGGALFEGGIHWLDLLAHLGPEVTAVQAIALGAATPRVATAAGERAMLVDLRYATGLVATLAHSWMAPSPLRGLRISRLRGSRGSVTFESNGLFVFVSGRRPRLLLPWRDITGRQAMFRDFVDAIRENRPPEFTLAHARRDVELVEAAYRSAGLPLRAPEGKEAA
jgi:predicted dehydrogenase